MSRLTPARIEDHWQAIRPCLDKVQTKAPARWSPDDVYAACVEGRAFLFVCPEGFCILRPLAGSVTTVQVWIVYGEGDSLITRYEPEIERLAREIGARRLVFTSTRPGYRRVMRRWSRDGNDYERYIHE
ncbi:hypothetical protein [Halomonas sp. NO4]|uniref:hypothetical protein n=1 Tax=Halomonas sp. NO4 TaxID=2484813 RepID=UPI0013D5E900|nr:hypothetical protein [Halomonas sp. NO4]